MKKTFILSTLLAVALASGLLFVSCPTSTTPAPSEPTSTVYSGKDTANNNYTLRISAPGKAAYTPKAEDDYKLDITPSGGGTSKRSSGTVTGVGDEFTLKPSNGAQFKVSIRGTEITTITGTITLEGSNGTISWGQSVPEEPNNPNPPSTGDTWSPVTSSSQVNGSWKAPPSYSGTVKGITYSTTTNNYIVTFDAAAQTMSASGSTTTTISGGNINEMWPELKALEELFGEMGYTVAFNDANHSITLTCNNVSIQIPDDDLSPLGLEINQNNTKLKMSDSLSGVEVIYTKL